MTAPAESGEYRFAYWTVSSYPAENYRDSWGRSDNPASFILLENTTATAHYLPATRDSDGDNVPDWYEMEYYGTLANDASYDGDGDSLTLRTEYSGGTHPLYANVGQPGGVSWADGTLVTCNLAGYPHYILRSEPAGTVDQSATVATGTVITTPSLAGNAGFGYWELDGVRQQDAWGVAVSEVSFTMGSDDRECVAYLFADDTDGDGVPDACEQFYYGTLANDGSSDTDDDGFTLLAEYTNGTLPCMADSHQEGGVSWADSGLVTCNLAGYSHYILRSEPAGTVDQSATVATGTVITTPSLAGNAYFGYWELDGVRQQDAWGVAVSQVTFTVEDANRECVAHLFAGDTDGDGVPDAYEYFYYGTLDNGGASDTDGDGFTLLAEYTNGTMPYLDNSFQDGGVSWADSELLDANLQFFERLDKILINGTLNHFFSPAPSVVSGVYIGAEAAAATTDWNGDKDFDIFIAHAAGLRVFRNIGTASNPDFEEIIDGFGGLASVVAALDHPIIAGGDWSGDGIGDLVIGGDTGTLRLVQSPGTFTSDGSGFDLGTGSARSRPALGDFDGDGRLDLLVLLADGTVRFFSNNGMPTPFAPPGTNNFLGTAAPAATSITTGDLDQDGLCDVLLADSDGRIWEFYQQEGGGFFLLSKVWGGSGAGFAAGLNIAACDLENDGDTDLIAGLSNGGLLALRDPAVGRPAGVTAEAGVDSVQLTWDASQQSRICGYDVYRATDIDGPWDMLNASHLPLPSYLDTAVTPGISYHYHVCGVSYFYRPGNSEPYYVQSLPSDTVSPTAGTVKLELQSTNGTPGSYVRIPLSINNALGLSGQNLSIQVTYDPDMLIPAIQADSSRSTVLLTGLSEWLVISDNGPTATGTLAINGTSGEIAAGSGQLFALQFQVNESATIGQSCTLTISGATLYSTSGYQAVVDFSGTAVFLVNGSYLLGDVNGDGAVTEADEDLLKILVKHNARPPTAYELRAGDLNGNGELDNKDMILLKRLLAGRPLHPGGSW